MKRLARELTVLHKRPAANLYRWLAALAASLSPWPLAAADPPAVAHSAADSLLVGLPGILIAAAALLCALYERSQARQLRLQLHAAQHASASAGAASRPQPTRAGVAAEHSRVGLWALDDSGQTLYANGAMCQLLGVCGLNELHGVNAKRLLRRTYSSGGTRNTPYTATLRTAHSGHHYRVLVFENRLPLDSAPSRSAVLLRTVIGPGMLATRAAFGPQQCLNRRPVHTNGSG